MQKNIAGSFLFFLLFTPARWSGTFPGKQDVIRKFNMNLWIIIQKIDMNSWIILCFLVFLQK